MAEGLGDYTTAAKFKELIGGIVGDAIDRLRPPQEYAIVASIEPTEMYSNMDRRVSVFVRYFTDPNGVPVEVGTGSILPTRVGQTVVVDGPRNNRRIVAVVGDADIQQAPPVVIAYDNLDYPTKAVASGEVSAAFAGGDRRFDSYGLYDSGSGSIVFGDYTGFYLGYVSGALWVQYGGSASGNVSLSAIFGSNSIGPFSAWRSFGWAGGGSGQAMFSFDGTFMFQIDRGLLQQEAFRFMGVANGATGDAIGGGLYGYIDRFWLIRVGSSPYI